MAERILVAVAWPYANGPLHLGHVAGCYLSADIFARYHRLKGSRVLMVSGSDTHGTPITIRADQEGVSPAEVVARYHALFLESWEKLGISFDLFTHTNTANHEAVTHDIFKTLLDQGYIYIDTMLLAWCPPCARFLPDRYVEGVCPHCGDARARGDQCDACGRTLDPRDLVEPRCAIATGQGGQHNIDFRESEHFFLRLSAFQEPLLEWVGRQSHWRPNVLNFTRRFLSDGLRDRAISRDLDWGVSIPLEGYESKKIYVWFEAVIGYLSAAVEWAGLQGAPDRWQDFWKDPESRAYYFIGKDNIPFHSIIWPAMIMAYGNGLKLPYDVPANEFLSLENRKFSTSQNWAVWVPDYLERYDPDPLRYLLSVNMPESSDADFSWGEFVRRNNEELVATYGNLVNRVLTFAYRNFDARIPAAGELDDADRALLDSARAAMNDAAASLEACRFKAAISRVFALAQEANRYLDAKAPWRSIRQGDAGRQAAASSLWVTIAVINCLKILLYPFMPFSSQRLHEYLGQDGRVENAAWDFDDAVGAVAGGRELRRPAPLYAKLEPAVVDQEVARLGAASDGA